MVLSSSLETPRNHMVDPDQCVIGNNQSHPQEANGKAGQIQTWAAVQALGVGKSPRTFPKDYPIIMTKTRCLDTCSLLKNAVPNYSQQFLTTFGEAGIISV